MTELLTGTSAVRWFPVITDRMAKPRNNKIPWRLAEVVYEGYSRRYGTDQSLERIAERGGFGILEIADYLLIALDADDELFDLMGRLGEALTNVLDVPHEEGCQYSLGGLYVCTRDCFRCTQETAQATLVDYRKVKEESQ